MKITKKEVAEKTVCTRGSGFNPRWMYQVRLGSDTYSKSFISDEVEYRDQRVGFAYNKSDFVKVVAKHRNEMLEDALMESVN